MNAVAKYSQTMNFICFPTIFTLVKQYPLLATKAYD